MIVRSLVKSTQHVWSQDPGLDTSAPDYADRWQQFLKDGDVSKLPTKEGAKLTVFEIEPLGRKEFVRVFNMSGLEQFSEAVAYGLRAVHHMEADGIPVVLERREESGSKRLTPGSLDKVFDPMLFMELGLRILDVSRMHPTSG